MGQSTNDMFPTATRLALLLRLGDLLRAARDLGAAFGRKSDEFAGVLKIGRTHLQDAVPITLGQEFGGYAACLERAADWVDTRGQRAARAEPRRHRRRHRPERGRRLRRTRDRQPLPVLPGLALRPAGNLFRVTQSMGDVLAYSGALRRLAVELGKIASDLRLLSMGPRAGLTEIDAAGRAARIVDHARAR